MEKVVEPRWLRDEPVDLSRDDKFGVDRLVDRLVGLLAKAKAPFTLSLSGAWGVGKSTIADSIVERLRERKVRAVKIDAWTQDVTQLRRSVVIEVGAALASGSDEDRKAIATELDEARATKIEVQSARIEARELEPTLRQIQHSWFAYLAVGLLLLLSWWGAAALESGSGLRPIFIALASVLSPLLVAAVAWRLVTPSTSRAPATEVFQLAKKFEEVVTQRPAFFGYKGPVIVVVDNLDRLSGTDALTALSQIRALVEISGSRCIFFIPIDRTRLSAHLGHELNDQQAATDYLEKFFNLDLQLAQPEPIDLFDWAYDQAVKLFPDADEGDRRSVAEIAVSAAGRSPRTVTRILNGTFTRHESIKPTSAIALRQLVFVEGLLTIAPGLADRLAAEPRDFVHARQRFGEQSEAMWQRAALDAYIEEREEAGLSVSSDSGVETTKNQSGFDRERLRRFLAANPDIALTREQLRLALTLREDRFWKDITEADSLKDALEIGDTTAFAAALNDRSQQERKLAIERSVQYVINTAPFRRVAVRALDAVSVEAQADSALAERLHRTALTLLEDADVELIASISLPTADFVFCQSRDANGADRVRGSLVAAIKSPTSQLITPLVLATRCVADLLSEPDLAAARERFATATLDEQAPIFADPPSRLLADGPVASAMLESLGGWTPAATGQGDTLVRAQRLIALAGVGWVGQTEIATLAARLLPQIPELAAAPEGLASLGVITELMSLAQPSGEFDQFGTQLANLRMLGGEDVFRYALRVPMQAAATASVGLEIQAWMQSSPPGQIQPLLEADRDRLEVALPTYRQVLLDLWESKGDVAYAELAVAGDAAHIGDVAAKWGALPPASCLQQAVPALNLTADVGDRPAVDAFIAQIVARIPAIPFGGFPEMPTLAEWLVRRKYERRSLALALEARVRAAPTPTETTDLVPALIGTADVFGGRQRAGLAEAIAEPLVTQNTGEPEQVAWIAEHLTSRTTRERLVVQLIERGLSIVPTLEAVRRARAQFDSTQVFEALVSRASREADEANALADLEAADSWQRPAPGSGSDAAASLESVRRAFPNLAEKTYELLPPVRQT
ncbi:MAG: P-loop NTPase fold protein [Chloroflexota bacterium]